MKRLWHGVRWLAVLIVLGILGFMGWQGLQKRQMASHAVSYRTTELGKGSIQQTVTANGSLSALKTVQVGSEVSGKIISLLVDFNAVVTNGQVIAQLDDSTYLRQLEQAKAELESAKASLELAEVNFSRAQDLRNLDLVSQADYDESHAALRQARAVVRMREASLDKCTVDLEKTTIVSPIDGIVISREVDEGQTVAASMTTPTLFTIAQDLRHMQIEAEISEADVGNVREGQRVIFTVDAYPNREFSGQVIQLRFQPVLSENVVNYTAIVDVENPDLRLRPGMTANASVITAERENVLRIPNAALRFRPSEATAAKVLEPPPPPDMDMPPGAHSNAGSAKAEKPKGGERVLYIQTGVNELQIIPVRIGITDGSWSEVLEPTPLTEGAHVVTGVMSSSGGATSPTAGSGGSSPFMPRMRPR